METNISQCVKSVKFLCNGVKLENSAHERKGNVQVIPRREIRLKGDALSTPCLKKHIRQALKFAWFLQHQDISRRHQFKADATNFHANSHWFDEDTLNIIPCPSERVRNSRLAVTRKYGTQCEILPPVA